jgi:hypothetical protein
MADGCFQKSCSHTACASQPHRYYIQPKAAKFARITDGRFVAIYWRAVRGHYGKIFIMAKFPVMKSLYALSEVHHEFSVHNFRDCLLSSFNGIWLFDAIKTCGSGGATILLLA